MLCCARARNLVAVMAVEMVVGMVVGMVVEMAAKMETWMVAEMVAEMVVEMGAAMVGGMVVVESRSARLFQRGAGPRGFEGEGVLNTRSDPRPSPSFGWDSVQCLTPGYGRRTLRRAPAQVSSRCGRLQQPAEGPAQKRHCHDSSGSVPACTAAAGELGLPF